MEVKFIVVLALVAVGHSSVVPVAKVDNDYTSFAYDVADPNTGDYKSQVETRVGGNVQGQYSLLESDGTKRIVDYAADDINGFNAVVRKDPAVVGAPVIPQSIVKSAPVVSAAPIVSGIAPEILATRYLAASSLGAPAPLIASRTVVPQSPALISSPGIISAPGLVAARTYGAPTLVAGSAPGLIAATKYAAPALVAASAPIVTAPYSVAASNYANPLLASRGLVAPGLTANLASLGATSYLSTYSSPLKYL